MTPEELDKIVDEIAPELIKQSSNSPEIADDKLYGAYMGKGFIGRFKEDELVMDKLAKDCAKQMNIEGKGNVALIEKALTEQYVKQPLVATIEADKFKIRKMERSDDPAAQAALPGMKEALAENQLSLNLVNQRMAALDMTIRQGGPDKVAANQQWEADEPEELEAGDLDIQGEKKGVQFDQTAVSLDGNVTAQFKASQVQAHLASRMLDELARDPSLSMNDVNRHLKNGAPAELSGKLAAEVKTQFSELIKESNRLSEEMAKLDEKINKKDGWTVDARTKAKVEGQIETLRAQQQKLFTDVQAKAAQDHHVLAGEKATLDLAAEAPAAGNRVRDQMRPLKSALKTSGNSNSLEAGSSSSNSLDGSSSSHAAKTGEKAGIQWTRTSPTEAPGRGLGAGRK